MRKFGGFLLKTAGASRRGGRLNDMSLIAGFFQPF